MERGCPSLMALNLLIRSCRRLLEMLYLACLVACGLFYWVWDWGILFWKLNVAFIISQSMTVFLYCTFFSERPFIFILRICFDVQGKATENIFAHDLCIREGFRKDRLGEFRWHQSYCQLFFRTWLWVFIDLFYTQKMGGWKSQ